MTITYVASSAIAEGETIVTPATLAGDLIILYTSRPSSSSLPEARGDFIDLHTSINLNHSVRLSYMFETEDNPTGYTFTWSTGRRAVCAVYRGVDSLGLSEMASAGNVSSQFATIPALTLTGDSYVVCGSSHLDASIRDGAITGATLRVYIDNPSTLNIHDTNGLVSSWAERTNDHGSASRWSGFSLVLEAAATGPVLTTPTLTATGETTATGTVVTDTATGTLYAYVSTSATAPSATDLKAGTGAVWSGNQAISTTGEKTFSVTGLTEGTLYYIYYLHNDGTDDSSIVSASATTVAATTGPSLTLASGTATSATEATGLVTTDTANGTLYAVVTTSATAPSVAQVQAGNDHTGEEAAWFGNQAISTTGEKTFSAVTLEPSTEYYFHFQHRDSSNDDSPVVSSLSFTTEALLGWTVNPAIASVTTNSITVTATPNQTSDVYAVAVVVDSAAPSSAQVIAGQNGAGTAAEAADSSLNVTGEATLVLNSTLDDPVYDVYVVATTA